MRNIFTLRNFGRSLILGMIGLILYYLIRIIFKQDDTGWMFYVIMFFTFFFINFVLGNGNRTWKELFKSIKKIS